MCPLVHFSEGNVYKIGNGYKPRLGIPLWEFSQQGHLWSGTFAVAAHTEGKSGDIS